LAPEVDTTVVLWYHEITILVVHLKATTALPH